MDIAYWAVVVAGGVTLVIEAYRQFSTSVDVHSHDRYPILKDVDLDALCTSGELVRGFLTYVALYLGAYAVILGSTEVFQVVAATSDQVANGLSQPSQVVGARGTAEDIASVTEPVDAFGIGKPMFVSATIIAALSIGIFAPVEKILRSYAHWIAAIPRGVYRVISGLKRVDYEKLGRRTNAPLTEAYLAKIAEFPEDKIDHEIVNETTAALRAIDLIQPSVTGHYRDQVFTAFTPATLENLLIQQDAANTAFRQTIADLTDASEDLQSLQTLASTTCNNIQALFALLYIRNQKEVELTRAVKNPTMKIIEHIQKSSEPALNALSGAVFFMVIAVLFFYPATYLLTIEGAPFETVKVFIRNETIVAILQNLLIFSICASTALLSREASQEYGRWKDWSINRIPFLRLFQHSVFPGVAAVLICVAVKLVEYLLTVQTPGSFDDFVRNNWQFCLMNFFFGFSIAVAVFFVVDQHNNLPAHKTVMLALLSTLPYVFWAIFVQSLDSNPTTMPNLEWMTREVFLLSMPAISFVLAFAILCEWSEEKEV